LCQPSSLVGLPARNIRIDGVGVGYVLGKVEVLVAAVAMEVLSGVMVVVRTVRCLLLSCQFGVEASLEARRVSSSSSILLVVGRY